MQPIDIITVPRSSQLTLHTKSMDDLDTYAVFLKRFSDSGGGTVATWTRDEVEKGITTTLDDANGYHIIISAKVRAGATRPRIRAMLAVGEHRFDELVFIPLNENVFWSILTRKEVTPAMSVSAPAAFIARPNEWP